MEILKNEQLQLCVSEHGAELQSIKDSSGHEYLWQADSRYWGRHSPLLFPIVCGLWNGRYRIDGFEYAMERHGFARDMDFRLIARSERKLTFALEDTAATHRLYPYRFLLSVSYRLDGNKIHVVWHVHNTDDNEIHFQIGGHPAFYVPGVAEGEPLHGFMRFDNEGPLERLIGNVGGCIVPGRFPLPTRGGLWEFTEESFRDDAVIIDRCQVRRVELLDAAQKAVVRLDMKTPAVGIWSPYGKHAPFVCIEPWFGLHDAVEYRGDFRKKALMNHLQPGGSFLSEYVITIAPTD